MKDKEMTKEQASEVVVTTVEAIGSELNVHDDYDSAINLQDSAIYHLLENNQPNYAWLLIKITTPSFNNYMNKQWGID